MWYLTACMSISAKSNRVKFAGSSLDKGQVNALTLFDLSMVFDTIYFTTLTDNWYGVFGVALNWIGVLPI